MFPRKSSPAVSIGWRDERREARKRLAAWMIACLVWLAPALATAAGPDPVFVEPPQRPTAVDVGMNLLALSDVSAPNEPFTTFTAELFFTVDWVDPRLAFEGASERPHVFLEKEAELELEQIWWPDVTFENSVGEREVENRELVIHPDGHVHYAERFRGTFSSELDLVRFPFDHQHFEARMSSFAWDANAVQLRIAPERDDAVPFDPDEFETVEWLVSAVERKVTTRPEIRSSAGFSEFALQIDADRKSGYYIWKIAVPLLLIVAFNWATFWMPGEPSSVRMERGVIALLTVVAFHQVVASNLPRIGYLTFMDGVVYLAFASVGLTLIANVWSHRKEQMGDAAAVQQLDRIARIAYPAAFLVALGVLWAVYHG